jgi:hypothetical protein
MAASAFDVGSARLTFAEGATVLALFGNAVAAGVCAFLRFSDGWISSRIGLLTAQCLLGFSVFAPYKRRVPFRPTSM